MEKLACFVVCAFALSCTWAADDLLVVTVATEETDGFKRFMRSAKQYGFRVKVLGMGEEWRGGDVDTYALGGHKINLLKKELAKYKNDKNLLIMFTESHDVVLTDGPDAVRKRFAKFYARVVFSADASCWPDASLKDKYPEVLTEEKRYLNSGGAVTESVLSAMTPTEVVSLLNLVSGARMPCCRRQNGATNVDGFIGYAPDLYRIVCHSEVQDDDDDQSYYTSIFVDRFLRVKWNMKIDRNSDIFMNLHDSLGDAILKYSENHNFLYNFRTGGSPVVVRGSRDFKGWTEFTWLTNYLGDGWTTSSGCLSCQEDRISLDGVKMDDFPTVVMGLFVEQPTPFIREFFQRIAALNYPKSKIDLFVQNKEYFHYRDVARFLDKHRKEYRSVTHISPAHNVGDVVGRNWGLEKCVEQNCQYYFSVDAVAQLTDPNTLITLIEQNRTIIGPMLTTRPNTEQSNFLVAVYAVEHVFIPSADRKDLVAGKKLGLWNVPAVKSVILIQGSLIDKLRGAYVSSRTMFPEMTFCRHAVNLGYFMFVTNQQRHGHLVSLRKFETDHVHNELYNLFENPLDWEHRYIHENYSQALQDAQTEQPCPDVYWFPIVSDTFCDEFVETMEASRLWSAGSARDPRVDTGIDQYPTVDIEVEQVDFENHWLYFMDKWVRPLNEKVFAGYKGRHDFRQSFIVRYRPGEQASLTPHFDTSSYTINIALNVASVDYEGGGCRFLRYDCAVTATRKGWMLMHPGHQTHRHEGLRVTNGTRYIMVTFVGPLESVQRNQLYGVHQ